MKRKGYEKMDEEEEYNILKSVMDLSYKYRYYLIIAFFALVFILMVVSCFALFYYMFLIGSDGSLDSIRDIGIIKTQNLMLNKDLNNSLVDFASFNFINHYRENGTNVEKFSYCPKIITQIPVGNDGVIYPDKRIFKIQTCNGNLTDGLIIDENGNVFVKNFTSSGSSLFQYLDVKGSASVANAMIYNLTVGTSGIYATGTTIDGYSGFPVYNYKLIGIEGDPSGLITSYGSSDTNIHNFYSRSSPGINGKPGLIQTIGSGGILGTTYFTTGSYAVISSEIVKTNITNTTYEDSANRIYRVQTHNYYFKPEWLLQSAKKNIQYLGVVAEEIEQIYPFAITKTDISMNNQTYNIPTVDYNAFVADLLNVVKKQRDTINQLIDILNNQNITNLNKI